MSELRYEEIPPLSRAEVEDAVRADAPDRLVVAVLAAALHGEPAWAATVCRRLATHPHFNVRGNALLGFAHLARRHRGVGLERATVEPLIVAGLRDDHAYVRGHAEDAADDLDHFLGWRIARPVA